MPASLFEIAGIRFFRLLAALRADGNRLAILFYHRVPEDRDALFSGDVGKNLFAAQMAMIRKYFHPLPLTEAVERLQRGQLPPAAVCITFDDGYRDNYENAAPILQAEGIPATVFVAVSYLDKGIMWNDIIIEAIKRTQKTEIDLAAPAEGNWKIASDADRKTLIETLLAKGKYLPQAARDEFARQIAETCAVEPPTDLMMSEAQVRGLQDFNIEIGGHTCTHPILKTLTDAEAQREIAEGKERLEAISGYRLSSFAYPNGNPGKDYTERDVNLVRKCAFRHAVSTEWGAADRTTDIYQIPRLITWPARPLRQGITILRELARRAR